MSSGRAENQLVLRAQLAAVAASLAAACAAPPRAPAAPAAERLLQQEASAGRLAYERGRHADAQALFRRALVRAEAIDAADAAADAAYNLALAAIALGDLAAAAPLLDRAEYDAARAGTTVADIRLVRAKLAYLEGRPAEAAVLAGRVLAAGAPPHLALQAQALRGQAAADGGDVPAARGALDAAHALAAAHTPSPAVRADLLKLEGTIAGLDGDAAAAARAFEAEAFLLRRAGRHRDMSHAYARAAAMYLRADNPGAAADRWFLAARSVAARGDADAARGYAASALDAAGTAGDAGAVARAGALLHAISRRDGR